MTNKLKVYSKPDCKPCTELKLHLTTKGISYIVVDVSEDTEAFNKLMSMGFRSVPQVFTEAGKYLGDGTKVKAMYP